MASNESKSKPAAREENAIFWRVTFALLVVLVLGIGSVAALGALTLRTVPCLSKGASAITSRNAMMTRCETLKSEP